MNARLAAFGGYGIELEYMIVDRAGLSVLPVADQLLRRLAEGNAADGGLAWSNELVLHLVELKNASPLPGLGELAPGFQAEIQRANRLLEPFGARLMPTGMHPWMRPSVEAHLWPHQDAEIYRAYERIFGCRRGHGCVNLQSMHLNLPFADDAEFARLHAATRLVLPILPALAASSPVVEGARSGFLDYRMEAYRTSLSRVPSSTGKVIPDTVSSQAEYEARILQPIYQELAPFDPEGMLRHEWFNARGAIARFERNAIEIRVLDAQECPQADLAIAAATVAVIQALYEERWASLAAQQAMSTDALAEIFLACIRDAERTVIEDAGYLRLLGFPGGRGEAGEVWMHLVEATCCPSPPAPRPQAGEGAGVRGDWQHPLDIILSHGPLARRILNALGEDFSRNRLRETYRQLCDCLEAGKMFLP